MTKGKYSQGIYEVRNKDKYLGTKNPRYMSSWELEVFKFFDANPYVKKWGAEIVVIPYYSQADERKRRYMVDLYVEYVDAKGATHKEIIEVKPLKETQPPVSTKGKKKTTYLREVYTWQVNQDKWKAAMDYAKKNRMKFRVMTENDIFR